MNQPFVVFKRPRRHKPPSNDASEEARAGFPFCGMTACLIRDGASPLFVKEHSPSPPLGFTETCVCFPVYCTSFLAANPKYLFYLRSLVGVGPIALQHAASFLTINTRSMRATISCQRSCAHHIEIIQDSSISVSGNQHRKDMQNTVPHSEELRTPILESACILTAVFAWLLLEELSEAVTQLRERTDGVAIKN